MNHQIFIKDWLSIRRDFTETNLPFGGQLDGEARGKWLEIRRALRVPIIRTSIERRMKIVVSKLKALSATDKEVVFERAQELREQSARACDGEFVFLDGNIHLYKNYLAMALVVFELCQAASAQDRANEARWEEQRIISKERGLRKYAQLDRLLKQYGPPPVGVKLETHFTRERAVRKLRVRTRAVSASKEPSAPRRL